MIPVTFVASEAHFAEHLAWVYRALPEQYRGPFWCGQSHDRTERAVLLLRRLFGIDARSGYPPADARGVAVANAVGDLANLRTGSPFMRFAFAEHGCGITYQGASSSYLGSTEREGCDLIVTPSERTAGIQRAATPSIDVVSIGSTPKLDEWAPDGPARARVLARTREKARPVVAFSFHYDLDLVPETRSAFREYRDAIAGLRDHGWELLGHAHPRAWRAARFEWEQLGIEPVRRFDEVLERADLYCVDNSSTLYEFAATGRPVVALNSVHYRRDVHHGLRFWEDIPGLQVDEPLLLASTIERALDDPAEVVIARDRAVSNVYSQHDGRSAARFAARLVQLADSWEPIGVEDSQPYKVRAAGGAVVASWATQFEAARHAEKIGGSWSYGLRIPVE